MRLLQFAPRVPWPLDTGAKLRNYHLARVLGEQAQVTLLAFTQTRDPAERRLDAYESVVTVRRDGAYSIDKVIRGAIGRTPLPLLNYTTLEMRVTLAAVLIEHAYDIVQVESIHLMNYLPEIFAAPNRPLVICDWHNIESGLMRQYGSRQRNLARRAYARKTARLMNEFERRALDQFDAHLVVSAEDARRLRKLKAEAKIFTIENGVDAASFSLAGEAPKTRVVFVGSMDYHANIDGAVQFAREVWPLIRQAHPELIFTIVGRNPSATVRGLSAIGGIEVTGSVVDVRPYYHEAIAAVVPLNVGGGSRLKILEAMAADVPVIATPRGAEGLTVEDGRNILLRETSQLASTINQVIEDSELRRQLIEGGHQLINEHYDWSRIGGNLFQLYQKLLDERAGVSG